MQKRLVGAGKSSPPPHPMLIKLVIQGKHEIGLAWSLITEMPDYDV